MTDEKLKYEGEIEKRDNLNGELRDMIYKLED
jgi:hypothetical protein